MSIPLKDFRLAISEPIHAALEARAAAEDVDMGVIARRVLQQWADREAHAYRVFARRVIANGSQSELPGFGLDEPGVGDSRKARR